MPELTLAADILDIWRMQSDLDHARALMSTLLDRIGKQEECPGCGQKIYWLKHRGGRLVAYDPDGGVHFEPIKG